MKFILYKLYYGEELVYIGRTTQNLQTRLHAHLFKAPHVRIIDINLLTKVEFAELESEADLFTYEVFYINKFKPILNKDDKARDDLTIQLMPELKFKEFFCYLLDKWKNQILFKDKEYNKEKETNKRMAEVFREQKNIKRQELSHDEYYAWLDSQKDLINSRLDREGW